MMKDLIILGAGPHAHEMADIVAQINREQPTWNLLGALAARAQAEWVGRTLDNLAVLGTVSDLNRYPEACFAAEFGSDSSGCPPQQLISLVAPSAFVAHTARIGAGCVIYPGCFIGHNARLGDRVFALSSATINHDNDLEDNVTLCSHVSLAGYVHVEAGSYLGQACTVKQYVRIGRDALIGMGSVVLADVPANSVMVGNPARRLRDRYPVSAAG
jgi:sugar O-acyltransferase (sialic acid O-acetyltransferase NeuD family)